MLWLCLLAGTAMSQVTMQAPSGESNYQWYEGTAGAATAIGGATTDAYSTSTPGVYFATFDAAGCGGATGYTIVVDACDANKDVTLNVGDNSGTYIWYKDGTATGDTNASITIEATTTVARYHAELTSASCTSELSTFNVINIKNCTDCGCFGITIQQN